MRTRPRTTRRRRSLPDVIAANLHREDPVPTPPVDLVQILMGEPS